MRADVWGALAIGASGRHLAQARAQRAARHVLHRQRARPLVEVVDGDHAGVAQRRSEPRLGEEAAPCFRTRRPGQLWVQHLERDGDVEHLVAREIDRRRAAAAQLAHQAVAQDLDAVRRHQRTGRALGGRLDLIGAQAAQMRPRLRVVDVDRQQALPAQRRARQGAFALVELGQQTVRVGRDRVGGAAPAIQHLQLVARRRALAATP